MSQHLLDLLAEVKTLAVAGDHAAAQRLIDAGVSRVEFGTPRGLDSERGIELIGQRVLPALNRG
jgi:hypothetical protein